MVRMTIMVKIKSVRGGNFSLHAFFSFVISASSNYILSNKRISFLLRSLCDSNGDSYGDGNCDR